MIELIMIYKFLLIGMYKSIENYLNKIYNKFIKYLLEYFYYLGAKLVCLLPHLKYDSHFYVSFYFAEINTSFKKSNISVAF